VANKRVSVPDFEEINLSKTASGQNNEVPTESSSNYILDAIIRENSHSNNVGNLTESAKPLKTEAVEQPVAERKSFPEIIGAFFNPSNSYLNVQSTEQETIKAYSTPNSYIEQTVDKPQSLSIVEEIPKISGGYASFVLTNEDKIQEFNMDEAKETETIEAIQEEIIAETLLEKPLNPEEAITIVKKLNIWTVEPSLEVEIIEPFLDYYYITRSSATMKKIGNGFVVSKTTGLIYQVNASMPENLNVKKVFNREIKPIC
jgi:rubrerythrin